MTGMSQQLIIPFTFIHLMEAVLKPFLTLLVVLFFAAPAFADQALILTEIEQVQEKIWYLQRDVAAQKAALEKHQQKISSVVAKTNENQQATAQRLDALAELINSQHERTKQIEDRIKSLKEAVAALVNEFNQQNAAQLQQAEKTSTQEGLLQALREELAASREKNEKVLQEVEQKLAETRVQLATMQEQKGGSFDQLGLYLGGAALAMAVLLTIAFAFLNSKSNRGDRERKDNHSHEL